MLLTLALGACGFGPDPYDWPVTPVSTPEGLIDASAVGPVSDMAWRHGEASWRRDALGDPLIEATMSGAGWPDADQAVPYRIEFHGCKEGGVCKELRFVAAFDPPPGVSPDAATADGDGPRWPASRAAIARWSAAKRMGEASIDEDGRGVAELNVSLQGGVTRQNLDAQFQWFRALLVAFQARLLES